MHRKPRRALMATGVVGLVLTLVAGPVSALTITKTSTPSTIPGKVGTVTHTITVSDCEDKVFGCFIFGIDEDTTCAAGVTGCSDGPVTECAPALVGGLGASTYTCTFERTYGSDAMVNVDHEAVAEGFIGLGLDPFSIGDSDTITIEADPAAPGPGHSTSVVVGQRVNVRVPRISVDAGDTERSVRRQANRSAIEREVDQSLDAEGADADKISRQVNSSMP